MLRVRSEFAPRRDHPQYVSTPLAVAGGDPAKALALVLAASATPTLQPPTPTPSPEPPTPTVTQRVTRRPAETDTEDVPRRADLPTATRTATPRLRLHPRPRQPTHHLHLRHPPPTRRAGTARGIARRHQALLANLEQLRAGDSYHEPELLRAAGDPGRSRQGAQTQQRRQEREPGSDRRLCPLAGPQRDGAGQRRFRSAAPLDRAGVPVLVETWLEHDGGMGHYRLVTGYDDAARRMDRLRLLCQRGHRS